MDRRDTSVLRGIPVDDFGRSVRAAVVDDDDFQMGIRLSDSRIEALGQVIGDIVCRNDQADQRSCAHIKGLTISIDVQHSG